MKKLILIALLSLVVTFGYSQTDSIVTNSTVEKLVDKYSSKIEATIVSLAESLKQPAEYVYNILIKQQYVTSFALLIISLVLISTAFFYKIWVNGIKNCKGDNTGWAMGLIFLCIAPAFIGVISLLINISRIFTGFINPEYGAIQEIIHLFN